MSFPSGVSLVRLDVAVTHEGRPARGLTAADFEVNDAGIRQSVELVRGAEAPVHAILLLDTSASVAGEKLRQLVRAARAFLEGLASRDVVTLIAFSNDVRLLGEAFARPADVARSLDRLAASGTTALLDAVSAATALSDARRGRPVMIVFSDGDDRLSWLRERDVIEATRRSEVVVHAVSFAIREPPRDPYFRLPNEKLRLRGSPAFLARVTEATGGRVFSVDPERGIEAAFLAILEELRERYVLTYEPAGVPAGGWHPLDVRVRKEGLTVRCRPGYHSAAVPPGH